MTEFRPLSDITLKEIDDYLCAKDKQRAKYNDSTDDNDNRSLMDVLLAGADKLIALKEKSKKKTKKKG